jgi:hypothetical protein
MVEKVESIGFVIVEGANFHVLVCFRVNKSSGSGSGDVT